MTALLPLIAALGAAATVMTLIGGLARLRKPDPVQARLDQMMQQRATLTEHELKAPIVERMFKPMLAGVGNLVARFTPKYVLEKTRQSLEHADLNVSYDPATFVALRVIAGGGFGLLFAILLLVVQVSLMQVLLVSIGSGVFAYMMPGIWLNGKAKTRQDGVRAALPDVLDLLTLCIEVMPFERALAKVVEKTTSTMREELLRTLNELRVGVPRSEALRNLSDRVGVDDLRVLVTTIIQADQLGTPLGQVLRNQSVDMRMKRRQRVETLAREAPVKMMFPLVFLVFPPLFIALLGPTIPQVMHTFAPGMHL